MAGCRAQDRGEPAEPFVGQSAVARFEEADHRAGRIDHLGELGLGHAAMLTPSSEEVFFRDSGHDALCKDLNEMHQANCKLFALQDDCKM
jgi:hypothetical protein